MNMFHYILINILHRNATINIINDSTVTPDILPYKISNTFNRKYQIIDNITGENITVGMVEFHKINTVNNTVIDQIIGYVQPDLNGCVTLTHILTDFNTNVTFKVKFINAINYSDSELNETIYINDKFNLQINPTPINLYYYSGSTIILECTVIDLINETEIINE